MTFGDQDRGALILNKHSDQLNLPTQGTDRERLLHLKRLEIGAGSQIELRKKTYQEEDT